MMFMMHQDVTCTGADDAHDARLMASVIQDFSSTQADDAHDAWLNYGFSDQGFHQRPG